MSLNVSGARVLDDLAFPQFGLIVKLIEGAVAGAVGGNGVGCQPCAVDVSVEIVLRARGLDAVFAHVFMVGGGLDICGVCSTRRRGSW